MTEENSVNTNVATIQCGEYSIETNDPKEVEAWLKQLFTQKL